MLYPNRLNVVGIIQDIFLRRTSLRTPNSLYTRDITDYSPRCIEQSTMPLCSGHHAMSLGFRPTSAPVPTSMNVNSESTGARSKIFIKRHVKRILPRALIHSFIAA